MALHCARNIVNAMITDGCGAAPCPGGIGIVDRAPVAPGGMPGGTNAARYAGCRLIAPGFPVIRTHHDACIIRGRKHTISPRPGVTMLAMAERGFGVAPFRSGHREMMIRTLRFPATRLCNDSAYQGGPAPC